MTRQRVRLYANELFDLHSQNRPDEGCWEWTGSVDINNYGVIGRIRAHRLSYERYVGPIPTGLYVCHHCDNPLCFRPSHLFVGTQKDNIHDALRKNRISRGEKHSAILKIVASRGEKHSARMKEVTPRGDKSWSRLHPEKLARGSRHGMVKFTAEHVLEIRRRAAAGERIIDIWKDFSFVKYQAIGKVIRRERWTHI